MSEKSVHEKDVCPKCGSTEIIKHELSVTAVQNDGTKQVEANKFNECQKCKHQWWIK